MSEKITVDLTGWDFDDWAEDIIKSARLERCGSSLTIEFSTDAPAIAKKIAEQAVSHFLAADLTCELTEDGIMLEAGESFGTIPYDRVIIMTHRALKRAKDFINGQQEDVDRLERELEDRD